MTDFSMHRLKKHAHVTKVLELVPEATLARLSGLFCPVLLPIQSVGVGVQEQPMCLGMLKNNYNQTQ